MLIEISYGEALDRLSILEIKISEINDEKKRFEIQKEIDSLSELTEIKARLLYYYNLLIEVNKKIWDLTNIIKSIEPTDTTFSNIANRIFNLNQSRFRLKTIINKMCESRIQEQKSYGLTQVYVRIENEHKSLLLKMLSLLSLDYDIVNISCDTFMKDYISAEIPAFNYVFNNDYNRCYINLTDSTLYKGLYLL
jgi:hypothetical protein